MANPVRPAVAGTGPAPTGRPDTGRDDLEAVTLFYGWDALSGRCFGAIPALRHLTNIMPALRVAVIPAGLFRGERVESYGTRVDFLKGEAVRLEAATGQAPALPFWQLIESDESPMANSAPPALALSRMQAESPGTALDFAHCVQEAHFIEGRDLNLPETYDDIIGRFVLPEIMTEDLGHATERTPEVEASYARADAMGMEDVPTLILARDGKELGRIIEPLEGAGLVAAIQALL